VYFIMIVLCASFFFYSSSDHLELHSFPTRRSSDLRCCKEAMLIVAFFNTVIAPDNARDHQRHLEEEHMSTIGFIGVGEIASAMVEGLHSATESAASGDGYSFFLSPRSTERSAHLAKTIEAAEVCDSNQDVVDRSELIVLAVLPQQAAAVLDELDIPADRTLISAVAGLATDQLAEHLPHSPTIVRI